MFYSLFKAENLIKLRPIEFCPIFEEALHAKIIPHHKNFFSSDIKESFLIKQVVYFEIRNVFLSC